MIDKNKLYSKTTLYAIGKTKEARFLLSDYKGALKLTVFEREIDNKKNNRYKLGCNLFIRRDALYALIDQMKEIDKKDINYSFTVTTYSPVWVDDKPTNEMKENGSITVIRKKINDDVLNYLVLKDNKVGNNYVFKLTPTPYYKYSINGEVVDESTASNIFTKSYAKTLESILAVVPEARTEQANITELDNTTKPINIDEKKEVKEESNTTTDVDALLDELI